MPDKGDAGQGWRDDGVDSDLKWLRTYLGSLRRYKSYRGSVRCMQAGTRPLTIGGPDGISSKNHRRHVPVLQSSAVLESGLTRAGSKQY